AKRPRAPSSGRGAGVVHDATDTRDGDVALCAARTAVGGGAARNRPGRQLVARGQSRSTKGFARQQAEPIHAPRGRPLRIAHAYGNTRARLEVAVASAADLIEADVWYRAGKLWVRHEARMTPFPLLVDKRMRGHSLPLWSECSNGRSSCAWWATTNARGGSASSTAF